MLAFHQVAALACLVAIANASLAFPVFAAPRRQKRIIRDSLSPLRHRTRKHKVRSPSRSGSITPVHVSFIPSLHDSHNSDSVSNDSPRSPDPQSASPICTSAPSCVGDFSDSSLSFGNMSSGDASPVTSTGAMTGSPSFVPPSMSPFGCCASSSLRDPWKGGHRNDPPIRDPITGRRVSSPSPGMPRDHALPRKSRAAHVLISPDNFVPINRSRSNLARTSLSYAKRSPANDVKCMYTHEDALRDMDVKIMRPAIFTEEHAHAYLTNDVPLRTHPIWTSLVSWTKENKHMVTAGSTADFPTWWKRFKMQARDHHIPLSITWRMANRLLPEVYQDSVLQRACHPDFTGFNSGTWAQFMTRETGGKDAVLLAVHELYDIAPLASESLSTFLMRFQTIASRARTASSILELGISAQDEFRLLHNVMLSRTTVFGKWVRNEWHAQYNVQAAQLRALNFTTVSVVDQSRIVHTSISTLIAAMRNIDAI